MLIRVEIPIDATGIDALLRRSLESDSEAKLVHDLRFLLYTSDAADEGLG